MRISDKSVLNTDKVGRLLFTQSLPAFVANLVTTTYNLVNTIFVGHYVGALGIAGIAIVLPIQFFSMGVGNMFGIGGASIISRAIGAGNREKAERTLANAIMGVIIVSIIVLAAGLVFQDFFLRLLGANMDILPYARDYYTIILFGLFFQTMGLTLANLARSEGSARASMISMILGAVSNIVFDAFFIIFMRMGVKGAAIGTVIAQFLTVVYFAVFYLRGRSYLKIHFRYFALKWELMKELLPIGFANFVMSLSSGASVLILNRALVVYGGDIAMAGYGIINRLMTLSFLPAYAIGQGLQPIIGFNYGTKRFDRAYKALKITLLAIGVVGTIIFVFLYFFPEITTRMFTSDPELITATIYIAKRVFLTVILSGFIITSLMIFQSLGKIWQAYVITFRSLLIMLPLVLILPAFFKYDGVLFVFPATEALAFVVTMILLIPLIRNFRELSKTTGMPAAGSRVPALEVERFER